MSAEEYNPLERYSGEFKESFSRNASEFFDALVQRSGVDAEENKRLVAAYYRLCDEADKADSKHSWLMFLIVLSVIALCISAGLLIWSIVEETLPFDWFMENLIQSQCICGAIALLSGGLLFWLVPAMRRQRQIRDEKRNAANEKRAEAQRQLDALNRLYTWDIPVRLFEKTVPDFKFDHFSSQARMLQFANEYGWDGKFDNETSVLFTQSGDLAGNPFAFCNLLSQYWGNETYYGSITIHWTTRERDSNGKLQTVHHSETLTASVTKPKPEYVNHSILVYGNEAAPNLSFTRECSGLAQESGFWGSLKMRSERKKLEKFSRNLTDESNYTMMANKEFETLFNTMDRNNEVEFRVLFTPLAQRQMIQLLKDTKEGFGDDFSFKKDNKINMIQAAHLNETRLDTNPGEFHNFDLEAARAHFLEWNNQYFKSLYFAIAPILAIPTYIQTLPESKFQPYPELAFKTANAWEYEATANFVGEARFKHPSSVTRNILKINGISRSNNTGHAQVCAYGFRTEKRTDYIEKFGGDGKFHTIPVKWLEYLPVQRQSSMD
ncbi:MAG: hypothetical protein IJS08_13140, partial [Victivallales bacterium]|nr:hypothetical protein [Victivallales bacterium]